MATIGTFTANDKGEFNGVIKTLTLNTKAVFRPIERNGDKSPDFRVTVGNLDIGAAWKKTSREDRGQARRSDLPGTDLRHPLRDRYRRRVRADLVSLIRRSAPLHGAGRLLSGKVG